jgi:uncharacterized damage-inducible protein DinB
MRDEFLREFTERWKHVHAMTVEFAQIVPDRFWDASPHAGFAPFAKQLRHVACVRGVYNEALVTGSLRFDRKHDYYHGELARDSLLSALDDRHGELLDWLADPKGDPFEPRIDVFGTRVASAQHLHGYVQHESIHHGQWSLYAASAGYETPPLWRLQWGLGAGSV